jgi:lysophospholipase L1-like esterase
VTKECKVFFFGDSICFGQGVSPHQVWVARIAAKLAAAFPDIATTVQNPSVNGNTTRAALERMPYDVQSHRPDVLSVQFGMNDCNIWESDLGHPRVSPDAFAANLCEIIDRGRLCGVKQFLLGVNHPSARTASTLPHAAITYDQSNRQYNAITRVVARTKNVELVDMERSVDAAVQEGAALGDFMLEDQLHLSLKGHDIYFAEFEPAVARAVHMALASGQ